MRVLFAGLGGIGQRHLRNLKAIVGSKLEVLAYRVRNDTPVLTDTLTVDRNADLEASYGIETLCDIDLALAKSPELVLVCNPTNLHVEIAQKAADAGCNLLIEKPLSHSLSGVDHLIESVERKGLVALVAFQWRFHPLLGRVRQILNDGILGRIVSVQVEVGEYLPGWHPYEDFRRMYAARKDQGGGVINTQSHELDYLLWLFGKPSRIFAMSGHRSSLEIDVEDTSAILMDIGGVPVQVQQDYVQRPPRRRLRIIGDEGKVIADLLAPKLEVFVRGDLIEEDRFSGFTRNDMFLAEMRHMLDCLAGRAKPVVSLRDGRTSLLMTLAAHRSSAMGEVVALE